MVLVGCVCVGWLLVGVMAWEVVGVRFGMVGGWVMVVVPRAFGRACCGVLSWFGQVPVLLGLAAAAETGEQWRASLPGPATTAESGWQSRAGLAVCVPPYLPASGAGGQEGAVAAYTPIEAMTAAIVRMMLRCGWRACGCMGRRRWCRACVVVGLWCVGCLVGWLA